jgi:multidrug resistance efflux pump
MNRRSITRKFKIIHRILPTIPGVVPGRPATIVVDMYPDQVFHGKVERLAGGTGAAFSLLPAEHHRFKQIQAAT